MTDGTVRTRLARVIPGRGELAVAGVGGRRIGLELWMPWPSQSCHVELREWRSSDLCAGLAPNVWARRSVDIPAGVSVAEADSLWVVVKRVHQDPAAPRNQRDRRIGLEVAAVTVSASDE